MSIAIDCVNVAGSQTWRRFQAACVGATFVVAVGCGLYGIETLLLGRQHRFVENPADTMMRAVGLAHFTIGWVFLFVSPRLRNRRSILRLTGCSFVGVALCGLFGWVGDKSPFAQLAFLSFFFIHEVWDEAHLYRQSGELAVQAPAADRFLTSLCASMSLWMVTTLVGFAILRGHWFGRSLPLREMSTFWLALVWTCLAVLATAATLRTIRQACAAHDSLAATLRIYRPLLMIYAGIGVILLVGSLFGSIGVNFIILIHAMTWLVHTQRQLSERAPSVTGASAWLTLSPAGFVALHCAVALFILVLFALRTHVWQRTGIVCTLLASSSFPYWGIMHISMAFWRGK